MAAAFIAGRSSQNEFDFSITWISMLSVLFLVNFNAVGPRASDIHEQLEIQGENILSQSKTQIDILKQVHENHKITLELLWKMEMLLRMVKRRSKSTPQRKSSMEDLEQCSSF
jgi:hypothetical protein